MGWAPAESVGRRKVLNFATRRGLVIPILAFRLALLPGHGIKRGHLLLHVLAAALGAFHRYIVFLEGENYFEGFVSIIADVVVHGHANLPLDRDHELRLRLYADGWGLCGSEFRAAKNRTHTAVKRAKSRSFASLRMTKLVGAES